MSRRVQSPAHVRLGDAIRVFRIRAHISQEGLGFRTGLHRNYVGAIERGEINPTYSTLLRVAAGFQMPLAALIAAADQENRVAGERWLYRRGS